MADGETWGAKVDANLQAIDLHQEWLRCRPWIEAALKRGGDGHTIEFVEQCLIEGSVHFWPGKKCAAVTEFVGQGAGLNFWLLGGDLDELVNQMRPDIEAWAKQRGCKRVMGIFGKKRRGWERVLKALGYRHAATTLAKEL